MLQSDRVPAVRGDRVLPVDTLTTIATGLFFLNSFLAVFNMVPVPPLDGSKVWAWNKPVYVVSMAAAVSLLVLAWL